MSATNNIDVSIVIVSWNVAKQLKKCLPSLKMYTKKVRYEVIVVDNNSSDDTAHLVKEKFRWVRFIKAGSNLGFAKANNLGIKGSKGKVILILNPDTIFFENTIHKLFNYLKSNPKVGAVGPKLVNTDGGLQPSVRIFPTIWTELIGKTKLDILLPRNRIFGSYRMTWWNFDSIREVDQIMGACMMIPRNVFDEVGVFDEQFKMYFEEVDLCFRIKKAGWKVIYYPDSTLTHIGRQSSLQAVQKMRKLRMQSLYKYFKKNRPFWENWLLEKINP